MSEEQTENPVKRRPSATFFIGLVLWGCVGAAGLRVWYTRPEPPKNSDQASSAAMSLEEQLAEEYGTSANETPIWDPDGIADFELVDAYGNAVTKADLWGRPWIVSFIFTRCSYTCPKLTEEMSKLQHRLADTDVRLVSISVDPDYDTPEVLKTYAERYAADPDRWKFLTGDKEQIYRLILGSFRLPVKENFGPDRLPGMEIAHSNFVLHVDAEGRVVEKYNGIDSIEMAALRRELTSEEEDSSDSSEESE